MTDQELVQQAAAMLRGGGSPTPGPTLTPSPTAAMSPAPSASPSPEDSGDDASIVKNAAAMLRGPLSGSAAGAAGSAAPMASPPMATPLPFKTPVPYPTRAPDVSPTPLPFTSPTPPASMTPATDQAIESGTSLKDLSLFNERMGQIADPGNMFRPEAWRPDTGDFPGVLTPAYHWPRVEATQTDVYPAWPLRGDPHKAGVYEAAAMNLANGFISGASSLKGLVGFLPPIFMAETARSLPELGRHVWGALHNAAKTPADSQERVEAVLALVATLVSMGFMRKAAINSIRRVNTAFRSPVPPAPNRLRVGPTQLDQISPYNPAVAEEQPGEKGFVTIKPQFRREPVPPEDESVGPVIEQEVKPDAEQQSHAQVQTSPAPQRESEGAGGEVPATGDSDHVVREAEGETSGRKVPPVKVAEEKKQERHPESLPVEELTDAELAAAVEKAEAEFDAGTAGSSEVFDLMREQYRRQKEKKKAKTETPSPRIAPRQQQQQPKEPVKETAKEQKEQSQIATLQQEASDLQNQLANYMNKPLTDEGVATQEKLWQTFNEIHALREASGEPRDFVIVGGGAAGLKAAAQAAYEGLDVVVLEKSPTPGGQAKRSLEIVNTGASEFGITGKRYFREKELTALNRGADVRTGVEVVDIKPRPDGGVDIITSSGGVIPAKRAAILTGAKPQLHPGFEYAGWGNAERLARLTKGKVGMVYGAGNSATQAVLGAIRRGAKKIYLLSRHEFGPEASDDQVMRIKQLAKGKNAKVEIVTAEITDVKPNPTGGFTVTASNGKTYQVAHLENFLDTSFNTAWIPSSIERVKQPPPKPGRAPKPAQIAVTDASLKTNMEGVYVGGDIRESLPGEDRPRRIDMAEGDAAGIAARVHRDILELRKNGKFPEWRPETPEETEAIDTRLKELKDTEHKVTNWEEEHGDVTPNAQMPPPPQAPQPFFREPQPEAKYIGPRPGFEGPYKREVPPETKRKVAEGGRAMTEQAAHQAADTATTSAQTQQQQRRVAPKFYSPELLEKEAAAKIKANAAYPDMVMTDLVAGNRNQVNAVDSTVLLNERATKQQQMVSAGKRAMDRSLPPGERSEAMANYTDLDNHIRLMDEATDNGHLLAPEEARAWHDYRMRDYTLPAMQTKLEIAQSGKPLTAAQDAKLGKKTTELADTVAQVEAMKTRIGFRIGKPIPSQFYGPLRDLQRRAHDTKVDLDNMIFDARFAQRSALYRYLTRTGQSMDLARAVMTSSDLSAVLRQGGLFARGHPILTMKEIPDMLRAARSDKDYFNLMQDIRERPNAELYVSSKLGLTDVKSPEFSRMEEAYASQWADKIPIVGHSQRAYVYFLNRMRADMFDHMAKTLPISGMPNAAQAKAISNFVNTYTGRGRTPAQLAGAMHVLNEAFFAPRYTISRFQVLYGDPFWVARNAKGVQKLIAQEYARTLIGYAVEYAAVYWAAKALGEDLSIEIDPRSSDWMSFKIGDTRWNPLAGLTQPAVFMARTGAALLEPTGLVKGSLKTPEGQIKSLRNAKYGERDWFSIFTEFMRGRFAPMPSLVANGLTGKKVTGQPTTWTKELLGLMYPITFGDVYTSIKAFGLPVGLGLALMAFFGDSVNTYATKPTGVRTKKPHQKGRHH